MTPKPKAPPPPPTTPSRADASVITAGQREPVAGFALITNSATGALARKTRTGKTVTTGGTS